MSGLKPIDLTRFYRSLHARGLTITELAESLNCGRSHLSQVLNGSRTGKPTWRKIEAAELLTPEELELLGRSVPRETNPHVEHEPQGVTAD